MILNVKDLITNCGCGKEHEVSTEKLIIQEGALARLKEIMTNCRLSGRIAVIYDQNTKNAVKGYDLSFDDEVVLRPNGLKADEINTAKVMEAIDKPDILIAVGAGTIHDITRWCANEWKIPFVSCPSAASVDGFCSSVSAMTWHGYKKTFPGVAPTLVIADIGIIKNAPVYLARSGLGDMLGKHISLADWSIARTITGEYYCEAIAKLTHDALDAAENSAIGVISGNNDAYEKLIYGLLLSGIAMQFAGNSRPASGAEHHISHFIEMGTVVESKALHGEKVGVASILTAKVYHRLGELSQTEIRQMIMDHGMMDIDDIRNVYKGLHENVVNENRQDIVGKIDAESITERWEEIRTIIHAIPPWERLKNLLISVGAKTELSDIGADDELCETILKYSPYIRNRLTLLRLANRFGLLDN